VKTSEPSLHENQSGSACAFAGAVQLPGAGRITVSVKQLKKTQQRSQKAIMIANEANDRITQGPTEAQFLPGSIGSARLG